MNKTKRLYSFSRNRLQEGFCLLAFFLCFNCFFVPSARAAGETMQQVDKKLTINLSNVSLTQVFDEIKKQSGYSFWYRNDDIPAKKVNVNQVNKTLAEVMESLHLKGMGLSYEIKEKHIVITKTSGATVAKPEASLSKDLVVSGVVTDETGEPVIGASVKVKDNPTLGAVTNIDGEYSINIVNPNSTLIFTYIGYSNAEVALKGRKNVDVVMKENVQMLNEVVVTGYQTISRERSTASYSILNNDELTKNITTNAMSAIQGKVAGLNTYNGAVQVRGISTFSSSVGTSPLIVVDGMPTERSLDSFSTDDVESITVLKDAAATSIYGVRAANGVIVVTTKKAETGKLRVNFSSTFNVTPQRDLDDYHYASTSEILDYAERYYQGNIRRNKNGESGYFTGKGTVGTANVDYYSPFDELHRQLYLGNINKSQFDQQISDWKQNDYRQEYQDLVNQTPISQNYNLAISKESGGVNTYLSLGYTNNNVQAIRFNNSESLKAYLKIGVKMTEWLNLNASIDTRYGSSYTSGAPSMGTNLEPYTQILDSEGNRVYRDWVSPYNPQVIEALETSGYINQFKSFKYNVLDEIENNFSTSNTFSVRSLLDLKFKLYKGLTFSTSFSYELSKNRSESTQLDGSYDLRSYQNRTINPTESNVQPIPDGAKFTRSAGEGNNYTFRNQLDYNVTLKDKHAIVALAGFEMREQNSPQGVSRTLYGYDPQTLSYSLLDEYTWEHSGYPSYIFSGTNSKMITTTKSALSETQNRFVSFYGNASYMFDNKYGLSGSVRVDETNLFTKDPKYRYRPLWSLGATWNMKKEAFINDIDWLDVLKVRLTYGVGGNVDKNSTPYLVGSANVSGNRISPVRQVIIGSTSAPNPLLRWEKTTTYNFGFDYSLLRSKIVGGLDLYYKYSDDLLCYKSNDYSSGFTRSKVNNGAMSNSGIEFSIRSPWYNRNDLRLTSGVILSYNKNRVDRVGLEPTTSELLLAGGDYFYEDYPRNSVYAYRYGGFTGGGTDAQNGIPYVIGAGGKTNVVLNPDGTASYFQLNGVGDVYYVGPSTPPLSINLNQGVKYKDFDLDMLFMFYGGHVIRRPSIGITTSPSATMDRDVLRAWTPTNTDTNVPKLIADYEDGFTTNLDTYVNKYWGLSDLHTVSGNMVRLSYVKLGYTLPTQIAKKLYMQSAKLSFQVNNPWYWSQAGDGIDPETRGKNDTGRTLPKNDSYVFRLEVAF